MLMFAVEMLWSCILCARCVRAESEWIVALFGQRTADQWEQAPFIVTWSSGSKAIMIIINYYYYYYIPILTERLSL